MSREAHHEAVAYAQAEIEAFGHRIMAAEEKLDEAIAAIIAAVGDPPQNESGRNALEFAAMTKVDRLPEIMRGVDNIKMELSRYAGGF